MRKKKGYSRIPLVLCHCCRHKKQIPTQTFPAILKYFRIVLVHLQRQEMRITEFTHTNVTGKA